MEAKVIESYLDTSFEYQSQFVQVDMDEQEHAKLFVRLQRQWTRYGESEPFASVLSDERFLKGNIDANMHLLETSGKEVVRRLQVLAARNGVNLPGGLCLELGCGVGRITKPLSDVFASVLAVDISPGNLRECDDYLRGGGKTNVQTLLMESPDSVTSLPALQAFLSIIVLQHNPPPIQYYLLDQIFGKLVSGGVAFFQTATFNPAYGYQAGYHLAMDDARFESWSLHCLPMRHILALMRKHGLRLLEVVEDGQTGGLANKFHSHTFFAIKE